MERLSQKQIYELPDELPSCDKGEHLKRSVVLQPNHLKSRKVKELLKPLTETENAMYEGVKEANLGS
jgi:hypothetical protein